MRGTLSRIVRGHAVTGIIPAHAGNTRYPSCQPEPRRDHPRACGEHFPESAICGHNRGSSPRMRGTRTAQSTATPGHGIIPAHAGNTYSAHPWIGQTGDHPRACGEHPCARGHVSCRCGSSPRMRGTRKRLSFHQVHIGIIPAHAGNTLNILREYDSRGDHPRACGEHRSRERRVGAIRGSSPRMRGTRSITPNPFANAGIIPAHAGNT